MGCRRRIGRPGNTGMFLSKNRKLPAFFLLISLGTAGLMAWNLVERFRNAGRMAGITIHAEDGGLTLMSVSPGSPGELAGLMSGDSLRAINGHPVRTNEDYDEQARGFRAGEEVQVDLFRDGQLHNLVLHPGIPFHWFLALLVSLTVAAYLFLAFAVFLQGPEDLRARLLVGFSLAVAIEMAMPEFAYGPVSARLLTGFVFFLISGIEMVLEIHLAAVIPQTPAWIRRHPGSIILLYVFGLGFGLLGAVTYVVEAVGPNWWPLTTEFIDFGMNNVLFPLWALGLVFLLGNQAIRYPTAQGRHQAGLVLVGVLPWAVYALTGTVYPGFYQVISSYNDLLLSVILLTYPVAVFFAIFRYHLFNVGRVVKIGLVYFTMGIILLVVFFALFYLGQWVLLMSGRESDRLILISGSMLVLGILFSPVYNQVQKIVERRFFPERSAVRQHLIELAGELPLIGNLPEMGRNLVHQLREIFGVRSVTLLIKRPGVSVFSPLASTLEVDELEHSQLNLIPVDYPGLKLVRNAGRPVPLRQVLRKDVEFGEILQHMGVSLLLPIRQKDELIGIFFIGERGGNERFPAEELELLTLLSHHVATTIENARLFESATYESLTGLLRREPLLAKLQQEVRRAQRYERPLSVGMADLDWFKKVNDTHGHLAGDALLRRVAQVMESCLRVSDVVGRYGGEEFLLVFPETGLEDAAVIAEKIRNRIAKIELRGRNEQHFGITVSIGLTQLRASEGDADDLVTELIGAADGALYKAKSDGRNCVRQYPASTS